MLRPLFPPLKATGRPPVDRRTKTHLVSEGRGRALAFILTLGQAADTSILSTTLEEIRGHWLAALEQHALAEAPGVDCGAVCGEGIAAVDGLEASVAVEGDGCAVGRDRLGQDRTAPGCAGDEHQDGLLR